MDWFSADELRRYQDKGLRIVYEATAIKTLPKSVWPSFGEGGYLGYDLDTYLTGGLVGNSGLSSIEVQQKVLDLLTSKKDFSRNGIGLYFREGANPKEIMLLQEFDATTLSMRSAKDLSDALREMPEFSAFKEMFVSRSLNPVSLESREWTMYPGVRILGEEYNRESGEELLLREMGDLKGDKNV